MTDSDLDVRHPVCVVGLGACSPLGLTAPPTAAAVRASISAVAEHPFMVDGLGDKMKVARVPTIDPGLWGVERLVALVRPAIDEAVTPILATHARQSVSLTLGIPEVRPGWPKDAGQQLAARLSKLGMFAVQPAPVTLVPHGHSAGLMAVDQTVKLVQAGRVEFALAGGVDSYLMPETLEWLDVHGQLMSARNRSGFPPGEAAGVWLLTTAAVARRRNLPILAWLVATGMSMEPNRIKTQTVCLGHGLTDVLRKVTAMLRLPDEKIDVTYCDLNGERYRNEEYAFSLLRIQTALAKNQNFLTPADCWGDIGAASGPLFLALAVGAAQRGYAMGARALFWTSSEGGERAAVIVLLPVERLRRA